MNEAGKQLGHINGHPETLNKTVSRTLSQVCVPRLWVIGGRSGRRRSYQRIPFPTRRRGPCQELVVFDDLDVDGVRRHPHGAGLQPQLLTRRPFLRLATRLLVKRLGKTRCLVSNLPGIVENLRRLCKPRIPVEEEFSKLHLRPVGNRRVLGPRPFSRTNKPIFGDRLGR